jgi:hypothetical protein
MPTEHAPPDAVHVDVLIVEDESLVSDYVEDILEGTRFDVVGVADAVPDAVAWPPAPAPGRPGGSHPSRPARRAGGCPPAA